MEGNQQQTQPTNDIAFEIQTRAKLVGQGGWCFQYCTALAPQVIYYT